MATANLRRDGFLPVTAQSRRYVALLRAINVGGTSVITMADLRAHAEAAGWSDVTTYIQSGNVLFTTAKADPDRLAAALSSSLAAALGHPVVMFILSPAQLVDAAAQNPFDPRRLDADERGHLMFLSAEPAAARCEALMALQGKSYRCAVRGRVLYYTYRLVDGRGPKLVNFEKVLGVTGTARTWKVVDKLIALTT